MYLNSNNPQKLQKQIEKLKPTKGLCIFIDICGSTAIKQRNIQEWILLIGNTIRFCSESNILFRDNVLKFIGDEIMIFIPEEDILAANENFATILGFLKLCISTNPPEIEALTLRTKAAIHYCEDTYNISFAKNANDYYGNDIDLTARLMRKSKKNEIVLSESFYQKIKEIDSSILIDVSDKQEEDFKGISGKVGYRIMSVQ